MRCFLLTETIQPCSGAERLSAEGEQHVAVLAAPARERERESFDMGIEPELDARNIHNAKAAVNDALLPGDRAFPFPASS